MQQHNIATPAPIVLAALILLSACDSVGDRIDRVSTAEWTDVDPAITRAATARLEQELATVEERLDSLPGLIGSVRGDLRRYLNDEHIARARSLGVAPVDDTAGIARLVSAGRLVRLPDSTQHWIVRELDQSLPYVTPEKKAALEELGQRFHERLARAGLPPFRFEISSAFRTGDLQQELRARNANASRKESSHEFGTTIDIAYNEFSPPSPELWAPWRDAVAGDGDAEDSLRARLDAIAAVPLDSLGNTYSDHLKGELGIVLEQMQEEGRIWPLYERSQPVFHTTLAGSAPAADTAAGRFAPPDTAVSTATPAGGRQ
ncbi:MAG TPA: DUF5715 family protein [Longimicrobiales bacterium]|nr:DUF5715 family protein [Longimicrobiales bacterium]